MDPDPSIIKEKKQENFVFLLICYFSDFLSLKNDVNVPSKNDKKKNLFKKISFLLAS
jgi:hypothetical protein